MRRELVRETYAETHIHANCALFLTSYSVISTPLHHHVTLLLHASVASSVHEAGETSLTNKELETEQQDERKSVGMNACDNHHLHAVCV